MERRSLGATGLGVSPIGFGASPLGNEFGEIGEAESIRAVHEAIDCGINFFDVSPYYGRTLAESRLGQALSGKREKVVLATKCGRYDTDRFDFSAARVRSSIDESLRRLRTDYVDLLQAHDIEFGNEKQIEEETIPALREVQNSGKARFIGITSYQLRMMARIVGAVPVDTVLSYCRFNLFVRDMDDLLTPVVDANKIGLINASPLHMGLLGEGPIPAWHPAPQPVRDAAARVRQLCRDRNLNPAQVGLRYCLNHPYVATTLVGMSSPEQVRTNVEALDLRLEETLLHELQRTVGSAKNVVWPSGRPENADYAT
ncbi:MAG TPA: aldo/keto reductase [Bryobacteraceae bacterium]|nr:aldo/keto reductase [Bryobacteraceae bacterium]